MTVDIQKEETKLKRAHLRLMRHPETTLYSGIILMGESSVVTSNITAYTDGINKRYGAGFLSKLEEDEVAGLVLHENLHVTLKHISRHRDLFKSDPQGANAAADYVVNGIIMGLKDKALCRLPAGGLYDARFDGWSVREVYDYLNTGKNNDKKRNLPEGQPQRSQGQQGNGSPQRETVTIGGETFNLTPLDDHDAESEAQDAAEQAEADRATAKQVEEALRQGGLLAGRFGVKLPRVVTESLEPVVDWRRELREFVTSVIRGTDELTWRTFNRRRIVDDIYFPSTESETPTELTVAIDTSGSIGAQQLNELAAELASICSTLQPDRVRVLWWDTKVHGEQVFTSGDYDALRKLLKPVGGGGTRVSCVSEYINAKNLKSDCVIVFTDGFVELDIKWSMSVPTLWLVTHNKNLKVPGRVVKYEKAN